MSFANLQELPSHNLQIPEFRPMPTQPVPVYNTTETIAPLLALAQYLSPTERAKRKAAIAKANYEYRLYSTGDPRIIKDPLFYLHLRAAQANIAHVEALTKKATEKGGGLDPRVAPRFKRDFGDASKMPDAGTYKGDVNTTSVITPTGNAMNNDSINLEDVVEPDDLSQNQ